MEHRAEEDAALQGRLERLGAYSAVFAQEGWTFGQWSGGEDVSRGVFDMPYFSFDEEARGFLECCMADGWVLQGFDWVQWASSEEAQGLIRDAEKLAAARPRQLACLLTMLIRQERFCGGTLSMALDSGLLPGIVRRAANLAAALARGEKEEMDGAW
jgi:hypothetical protein